MTYTKTGTMAYNLHIIKTDRFKKVLIRVNFRRKFDKKGITYRRLLGEVLLESTKNYPTAREMNLKYEDLYSATMAYNVIPNGQYQVLSFQMGFLNDEYTEVGNAKEAISFLNEILFKPNVVDDHFEEKSFAKCKNFLTQLIELKDESPKQYARRRFLETMFPKSDLKYTGPGYMEDLEEITEESLYEYYKSVLNSDYIDIFVCGNVDEKEIEDIFKETFEVHTFKKKAEPTVIHQKDFRKRCRIVTETRDIKQSELIIGAKVEPMTEFERKYTGNLYAYILGGGGGNSLLFKTIREKYSFCYAISATMVGTCGYLSIQAGLDKENAKKAISLIRKILKDMADGNFEEEQIEDFKMITKTVRKELFDSAINMIDFYQIKEYVGIDDYEVLETELEKLTKSSIMEFSKKVKLDTIYLLEGGKIDAEDTSK